MRTIESIPFEYNGVSYRSKTEARWAIFFDSLELIFEYEREGIRLSTGELYLPDFYLPQLNAWFEVKPNNDQVVEAECLKARQLAADRPGARVWLAAGQPSADEANVIPLNQWVGSVPMEQILSLPENRYRFLEDRRDGQVYWLHSEFVRGSFSSSYMVGGPGISTDHERLPILSERMRSAYSASSVRLD